MITMITMITTTTDYVVNDFFDGFGPVSELLELPYVKKMRHCSDKTLIVNRFDCFTFEILFCENEKVRKLFTIRTVPTY